MKIKLYGTRGSFPTPSSESRGLFTDKYGGNTTCLRVTSKEGETFIVDAGTGIRLLGNDLLANGACSGNSVFSLLFTHEHQDHIEGIPSFKPLYLPNCEFHIYAKGSPRRIEELLRDRQSVDFFPVLYSSAGVENIPVMASKKNHHNVANGIRSNGIKISCCETNHPDGCLAYRFQEGNKVFAFSGDHELDIDTRIDTKLIDFLQGTKILVMDSQYLPEERTPERYNIKAFPKKGWGHSDYEQVVNFAIQLQPNLLVLTHHDPEHDDTFVGNMEQRAQEYAKTKGLEARIIMAREGLELEI